ncbi:hypothetical protein DVH24_039326 [Malus domestica]|uniref:Uncharacterized protein n=1 Tax=Malus domestica TaxID=3750 RepID=A0A498I180_MALDO|nr:hypothetical protein DVH24_039326 [Malus domestica]
MTKLRSSEVIDQEEGIILFKNLKRTREKLRISLCTPRLCWPWIRSYNEGISAMLEANAV